MSRPVLAVAYPTVDLDAYHARLTAVAGEYRFLYDEHGEVCGAYPADEDVLPCGCEVQCDSANCDDFREFRDGWLGEPENGYDESADREDERYDWPDGEVPR